MPFNFRVLNVEWNGTIRMSRADWVNSPTCHWSNDLTPIVGLNISFPVAILSETCSRLWGERRLCGATGRKWIGPFQDDAFSGSLLSLSRPWWDVSLIIIYVPIKIISLSETPNISYTWEVKSHQKSSILHIKCTSKDFTLKTMYTMKNALPKYLILGEKRMK